MGRHRATEDTGDGTGGDWRDDTVERLPRVRDDKTPASTATPSFTETLFTGAAAADPERVADTEERRRAVAPLIAIVAAVALALAVPLGALLILTGGPEGSEVASDPAAGTAADTTTDEADQPSSPTESAGASATGSAGPSSPAASPTKDTEAATPGVDLRDRVEANAPVTAPAGTDVDGNPVSYDPANMVDSDRQTAWRMPGDGTGQVLTFKLPQETTLTRVALINGYAKSARDGTVLDWYGGNRRIHQVRWTFDDGTSFVHELSKSIALQFHPVDEVVTRQVKLEILQVSPPGTGPESRDYTAISEIALFGHAG